MWCWCIFSPTKLVHTRDIVLASIHRETYSANALCFCYIWMTQWLTCGCCCFSCWEQKKFIFFWETVASLIQLDTTIKIVNSRETKVLSSVVVIEMRLLLLMKYVHLWLFMLSKGLFNSCSCFVGRQCERAHIKLQCWDKAFTQVSIRPVVSNIMWFTNTLTHIKHTN